MGVGIDFKYYKYTADDGTTMFNVRLSKQFGEVADLGFAAYDTTKTLLPRGWKMRYVLLLDPLTGNRRKVPCGTVGCDVYTGAQATVDLPVIGATAVVTFTTTLAVGERKSKAHPIQNL